MSKIVPNFVDCHFGIHLEFEVARILAILDARAR